MHGKDYTFCSFDHWDNDRKVYIDNGRKLTENDRKLLTDSGRSLLIDKGRNFTEDRRKFTEMVENLLTLVDIFGLTIQL